MALVLVPSFAIVSSSQSNNTLPSDSLSNSTLSNASISDEADEDISLENETSFASLSRSLAEANQAGDEPISPPPPSESESEGEAEAGEEDPNE